MESYHSIIWWLDFCHPNSAGRPPRRQLYLWFYAAVNVILQRLNHSYSNRFFFIPPFPTTNSISFLFGTLGGVCKLTLGSELTRRFCHLQVLWMSCKGLTLNGLWALQWTASYQVWWLWCQANFPWLSLGKRAVCLFCFWEGDFTRYIFCYSLWNPFIIGWQ